MVSYNKNSYYEIRNQRLRMCFYFASALANDVFRFRLSACEWVLGISIQRLRMELLDFDNWNCGISEWGDGKGNGIWVI